MIPGRVEFFDMIDGASVRFGWPVAPSAAAMEQCRVEAICLDDFSGDPVVEAAALFFALAFDERRTRPATGLLPFVVALHHLHDHRTPLRLEDPSELAWLRHAIAEGSADWPEVRAWFRARTGRAPEGEDG
ncbi:MAG TPA: hypothetical protein VK459_01160 [Polyangiaceae bacterium]|nr:hypothetical protein [Polyangiaceae bacterium]